jgi:hypothetical protein
MARLVKRSEVRLEPVYDITVKSTHSFFACSGEHPEKGVLVHNCHQLSKDALDALLKPMEDNDRGSFDKRLVCIFATTEPEKMRQTVLSRCAPAFIIKPVDSEEIADRLAWVCDQEGFNYEREALVLIAQFTEGHIRDALKAIEGVASSNEGLVGLVGVRKYLHVDRNDVICNILLKDNVDSLSLVDDLLQSTPVGIAYDRLLDASMMAVSLGMGASNPPPYWNKGSLQSIWDRFGMNLLTLSDSLASRPLRPTSSMFKCDVLKWKVGGLPLPHVAQSPTPTMSIENTQPNVSSPEPTQSEPQAQLLSISAWSSMVKRYLET